MKKVLVLLCTILCANVLFAQTRFWVDSLQYEVTSTAKVEVYDANYSITTAIIPSTVTYQETTYDVTSIGYRAFYNCSSLTSVTIPNSVTSIAMSAFEDCSSLTTLNFNAINCEDFDSYEPPFYNLPITTINIGDSVQRIPAYFAYAIHSLTSITIPNSVTSIGRSAFYDCSSLSSVNIPNSVTYIGDWAFRGCSSLTSVDIPNSVTSIGNYAFCVCSSLTSVTIPNSVTSIGDYAFAYCSSLTSITIPESVTTIYEGAFGGCNNLTTLNFNATNCNFNLSQYLVFPTSITTVNIGENVQVIPNYFIQSTSVSSIDIPNSVTSIGNNAFNGCSILTSVTCLRLSAPSLGTDTFEGTPNYKILTIPCGANYSIWQNETTWESVDCFITIGSLFTIDDLRYQIIDTNEVIVYSCNTSATSVEIPLQVIL